MADESETLLDKVKEQAPTALTSAVFAVVAVLALGGRTEVPVAPVLPDLPAKVADPARPARPARHGRDGLESRLVSCGDSTMAKVAGDDTEGVIAVGTGATGCTLLFSAPWSSVPTCAVNGGTITSVTQNELVIDGVTDAVAYRCGGE